MWRFLQHRWFLIALCGAIVVGVAFGRRLAPAADAMSKEAVIGVVMLLTALGMNFRRLTEGRGGVTAIALAILVNVVAAPPLAWLAARGLGLESSLAAGLVIAAAVPCTVASAIVWTRRGGGNDAVAATVSMVTNFACFLTLPFWTGLLLRQTAGPDPAALALKLLACVAAPMAVGQALRMHKPLAGWADRHKPALSVAVQLGLLLLVLAGAVKAGERVHTADELPAPADWGLLLVGVLAVHVALLLLGWRAARAARLPPAETLAVAISGSQKTLAVGLGVAMLFGPLAIFPMIAYHFSQLVIDTFVVDHWRVAAAE